MLSKNGKVACTLLALSLALPSCGYAVSSDDDSDAQEVMKSTVKTKKKVRRVKKKTTVVQESPASEQAESLSHIRYAEDLSRLEAELNDDDVKLGSRLRRFLEDKPVDPYGKVLRPFNPYGKLLRLMLEPENLSFIKNKRLICGYHVEEQPVKLSSMLMTIPIRSDGMFFAITAAAGLLFKQLDESQMEKWWHDKKAGIIYEGDLHGERTWRTVIRDVINDSLFGRDLKKLLIVLTHLKEERNQKLWESFTQDRRHDILKRIDNFHTKQLNLVFENFHLLFGFKSVRHLLSNTHDYRSKSYSVIYSCGVNRMETLQEMPVKKLKKVMAHYSLFFDQGMNTGDAQTILWSLSRLSLEQIDNCIKELLDHPEKYGDGQPIEDERKRVPFEIWSRATNQR